MKKLILLISSIWLCNQAYGIEKTPLSTSPFYLTPYVGIFDILDKKNYGLLGAELRGKTFYKYVVPKIGFYITEKNSNYTYIGFNLDFPFFEKKLYLSPGFSIGNYSKHKGKRLGGALEFRSSIEIAYKFANEHRIGIAFSHISNAKIYKKNPGAEDLIINYSIPLSF